MSLALSMATPAESQQTMYGLLPAAHFTVTDGNCVDCRLLPQAAWYFRQSVIAVPGGDVPRAGYDRQRAFDDDLRAWSATTPIGSRLDYPPLVWLAAPDVVSDAHLDFAEGKLLTKAGVQALAWAPRLPLNGAWLDQRSMAFLAAQPLKVRGWATKEVFTVNSVWPQDFRLPLQPAERQLAPEPTAFRAWLRALPQGGASAPFAVESIWQRKAGPAWQVGQPVLGLMLNGAQGDDDEAHGGHFAVMTGRVGVDGAIDDWLVYNFYTLDTESEKGIIAAPVPLDNYLADLNAGQAWYRPSWLLVAALRDERTAAQVHSAFSRAFNLFYRHQLSYQHARANCAGISVRTLRSIGWQVPVSGAESWLRAIPALPWMAVREGSLQRGQAVFDYLTEDRSLLYPAVAFEQIGADLLRLLDGQRAPGSEFERLLAEDVAQLMLVRVPQLPSSRAWGHWPIASSSEYLARIPADPAQRQIIPVAARPFPAALRDPQSPREPWLRSDYALAAYAFALLGGLWLILRRLLA